MTALIRPEGDGVVSRLAIERAAREAQLLIMAIKRAMPFVVRRGGKVTGRAPISTTFPQLEIQLDAPTFALPIKTSSGASGFLAFDGSALSMIIDGVLGGDGSSPPELRPEGLSAAQSALSARLAESMVRSISEALAPRLGFALVACGGDVAAEVAVVATRFDVELKERVGAITLAVAVSAFAQQPTRVVVPRGAIDPSIAAMLADVEVDLAVELGRVPIKLGRLSSLKVGATFVSDLPVGRSVSVLADGRPLFVGRPTALAGQFAVKLEKRIG